VASHVGEHQERTHSARYLVFIFLACVATCGVFFSLGFLVGYNERGSRSDISTEAVATPPATPPAFNQPDSPQATPQDSAAGHATPGSLPETEILPAGGGTSVTAPAGKGAENTRGESTRTPSNPSLASSSTQNTGLVGEGITLQVAALRTQQDAKALVEILKSRGYPVFLVTPEYAHAGDNLYRVQVGPFQTRADAETVHDKLVKEGFKPFIRH
jgi:cell division septation protein DedD